MIHVLNIMGKLAVGGMEATVMSYYRHISNVNIKYDFLVSEGEKEFFEDEALSLGARIFKRPLRSQRPFKNVVSLCKILRRYPEIKIIHIHGASPPSAVDLIVAAFFGIRIRIATSGTEFPFLPLSYRLFQPLLRLFATHWMCRTVRAGQSLYGKSSASKYIIMPPARDLAPFRYNIMLRSNVRHRLGVENKFLCVNVARLQEVKNQSFLINSFAIAKKTHPNLILFIVGRDFYTDRKQYEQLVSLPETLGLSDSVIFLGQRDDIPELLQAADLFLLPSIYEGLPGAAIEAQAAGLPCVLSDRINPEVKLIDSVEFLAIDKGPEIWAHQIVRYSNFSRHDTLEDVRSAGYDIKTAAKWLENFYASEYERKYQKSKRLFYGK